MKRLRVAGLYIVLLTAVMSVSSCVYHSRQPHYDNGYGYRHQPRTIIVRPSPPPRVVHRNHYKQKKYHHKHSNRYNNRERNNRYGRN
jgi:hypothetical protein